MQTRFIAFLNLIRLPNLLMLALVQILVIQFYLPAFLPFFKFEVWKLITLIISVCFLAAGGNLINAYFDQQTDLINKSSSYNDYKHVGKRNTLMYYALFSITGIALGFFLSSDTGNYFATGIYLCVLFSLFGYSKYVKGSFLLGNLIVSLLVGLSFVLPCILSLEMDCFNFQNPALQLFFSYILFSVCINLARELAKDVEDVVGDFSSNHRTFPIVMGKRRTKLLIQFLVLLCLIGLIFAYFFFFIGQLIPMLYIFLVLISTGIFIFVKTGKANHKKDFSNLSTVFKIWMFLGLISLGFFSI